MSRDDLRIAVVGGGIGGLAAALSLLRAGFDVQVFEQASALMEVGAGIQISPNASRLLHRLGLGAALDRTGVRPVAVHQRRWDDGRTLQRAPLGEAVEAAFGAPYYHFHRADLLKVLADSLPSERCISGTVSPPSPTTVIASSCGSPTVSGSRPACSSAPTASIPRCAASCSARSDRASPAASPIVGWFRPIGWGISSSKSWRTTGWVPAATSCTTSWPAAGSSISWPSWSVRPGPGSPGPTAVRWPTRWPPSRAGTLWCARSSALWMRPSSGRSSTAPRSSAGRSAASRSSATPATPCCPSWRRAPHSPSRMARRWWPVCGRPAWPTSPPPCGGTRRFGGRGRHACRRCRAPTRRASTFPTVSSSKRATWSWPRGRPDDRGARLALRA